MEPELKILIIDNSPLYALGLKVAFSSMQMIRQVDICATYDDCLVKMKEHKPDLVFLELNLDAPRHDGFEICREISQRYIHVFVAVLSRYNHPRFIKNARECGAGAYFDKTIPGKSIQNFVRDFSNGAISRYIVQVSNTLPSVEFSGADGFEALYLLPQRAREEMKLILEGKCISEIESEMNISYDTYKTYHNKILKTFGVANDVELTKFALHHHLTDFKISRDQLEVPPGGLRQTR